VVNVASERLPVARPAYITRKVLGALRSNSEDVKTNVNVDGECENGKAIRISAGRGATTMLAAEEIVLYMYCVECTVHAEK
jgi:cytoskeletal protein CcmA (bactofilin family)